MQKTYTKLGYKITEERLFDNEAFGIDEKIQDQMEDLYFGAQDKNDKTIIPRLRVLIKQYPKAAILKNYLEQAYRARGEAAKGKKINEQIISEHPDYLYGRLMQATYLLNEGSASKIPELLGEDMDIRKLFPEREVFHLDEVTDFLKFSILYFVELKQFDKAKKRHKELKTIRPYHPEIEDLLFLITSNEMANMIGLDTIQQERRKTIVHTYPNITTPPAFQHPEIEQLYNYDFNIPFNILKAILDLPRTSLIADLENVLSDAVNRYNYFAEEESLNEENAYFPLHAISLLTELRAKESLLKILSLLKYDNDFLDFWFGDILSERLWLYFYRTGLSDMEQIKKFLYNPDIDSFSKSYVTDAMIQTALHYPERKGEIIAYHTELFDYYLNLPTQDAEKEVDPDFIAFLVGNVIDGNFVELTAQVKELYEKKYVSLYFQGDYDEFIRHLNENRDYKKEIPDIFTLYQTTIDSQQDRDSWFKKPDDDDWSTGDEDTDDDWRVLDEYMDKLDRLDMDNEEEEPFGTAPFTFAQIGRNDPCPCGSGKKYKKCCMEN